MDRKREKEGERESPCGDPVASYEKLWIMTALLSLFSLSRVLYDILAYTVDVPITGQSTIP